jgi:hypothetical protein
MLLIDIYTDDVLNVWNLQGQDERKIRIRVLRRLQYPHCFWAPGTARHLRPLRTTNQPHPKLLCYGHFEAYIFHIYSLTVMDKGSHMETAQNPPLHKDRRS